MARSEYWSCPLRLPTPAAAHVAIASGVSQRVTSPRRTRARSYSGVGAQPFGCDEAAVGSLATVTAAGARSRHEIKGPSEVQGEVSRGELVSVRAGLGPARGRDAMALCRGVVARIVTGPHEAHRQDPHLPMRYDTGRPSSVIRLRISQPRTASLPCPAGLRARRPSPMMDLYRKNVFSTRL